MANQYLELKKKHQKEINEFPIIFAFSNKQLDEGMEKMGIKDTKELCSAGAGGYIKKTDAKKWVEMFKNRSQEIEDALAEDKTGEGYIRQMFQYELDNHEYNYTMDASDTLDALGLTREEVLGNEALLNGFRLAGGSYI